MRVLFAQNTMYAPAHDLVGRPNRVMLEQLAARGHDCAVVAPVSDRRGGYSPASLVADLAARGIQPRRESDDTLRFRLDGIEVHAVPRRSWLAGAVRRVIVETRPDRVVVPSDDADPAVLGAAIAVDPDRVVYLAQDLQHLPFGPAALNPGRLATDLVRRAGERVAVSTTVCDYLDRWAGLDAYQLRQQIYTTPAPADARSAVGIVNPGQYQGIGIFADLADTERGVPFVAVPGPATTAADLMALGRRPNVRVAAPSADVDRVLRGIRVLLVPSLWDEAFSPLTVEAMARGIPVLASNVAGLAEAKLGVPYLVPVRRLELYHGPALARPVPVVPVQDLSPWRRALRRLLAEPAHYHDVAERSRRAAGRFIASLRDNALEEVLTGRLAVNAVSRVDMVRVPVEPSHCRG